MIDAEDLAMLLGARRAADADADINGDGDVDGVDLSSVPGYWGGCP